MKTCPECETQYEDHVAVCLVDGVRLDSLPSSPSTRAPRAPQAPVNPAPPAAPESGLGLWVAGGVVFVLLAISVGLGGLVLGLLSGDRGRTVAPIPVGLEDPAAAAPAPAPPTLLRVGFTSDPQGATLYEGASELCTTPCVVDHPEFAPLPRSFVLKHADRLDTPYSMTDPSIPQLVRLLAEPAGPGR